MNNEFTPVNPAYDLTGKVFGLLTVLHQCQSDARSGAVCWVVRCECGGGANFFPTSSELAQRRVKNCGCVPSESKPRRKYVTALQRAVANANQPALQRQAKQVEVFLKDKVAKGWNGA